MGIKQDALVFIETFTGIHHTYFTNNFITLYWFITFYFKQTFFIQNLNSVSL